MRFLCCSLSSPGFLFPMLGLAESLRSRGHDPAFVASGATKEAVERRGFACMTGRPRIDPFETRQWFSPLSVALQYKYADRAIAEFKPAVVVAQPLTLGPTMAAERRGVPVAMMGFATYLWPSARDDADGATSSAAAARRTWRARDMHRCFNEIRSALGFRELPADFERSALLGDLFLLRTVPELEPCVHLLPPQVHPAGPCLWEPDDPEDVSLQEWMGDQEANVYYVHLGRVFDRPSFWPDLVRAFGGSADVRVVASVGRMDGRAGAVPPNFLIRSYVAQGPVLRRAAASISSAHTTVTLGALRHAVPNVLIPTGGEEPDLAECCQAAGVSTLVQPEHVTVESLRAAVDDAISRPVGALCRVRAALTRDGGFDKAASLVETLARTQAPVRRGERLVQSEPVRITYGAESVRNRGGDGLRCA